MAETGLLTIATGMSAKTKIWKNKSLTWQDLVALLAKTQVTRETFKEYMASSKEDQAKIKDVGGFVGGYLRNGRRKPENVVFRQVLTLDLDFAHLDFWDDLCMQYSNAAVLHGTHKFSEENPRFRLAMPLSRECTPDEYVAVTRRIAGNLNIELFDNTTFDPCRLMYWPSSPKDVTYYFREQEGEWLDVDKVLASYIDWKDSSLWPTAAKYTDSMREAAGKQQDPLEKKGVVGAFCRTYGIAQAIETFLADVYTSTTDGRYTYAKGTTSSGMVVYEDKFAFSHHGTDPTAGMLCNAFDLVRVHKFGHLDEGKNEKGEKAKSYEAMVDFASSLSEVKGTIAEDKMREVRYEFEVDESQAPDENSEKEDVDLEWMSELEIDGKGKYLSSSNNLNLIFAQDPRLKKLFSRNEFDGKSYLTRSAPWRRIKTPEVIKNVDFAGVRNYIESVYGITGTLKVEDAMVLETERQLFHPIKDYFSKLTWDGEKRVETLLVDYFGVDDTAYHREAITKMLTGAVARVFRPGVKFDLVLTLVGGQGLGKSTFVKKLGLEWFSDTFMTVHGKEALEQIQGAWIIEIAELSGMRKADVEAVKHFISKQVDTFRPAYARTSETYPRQCVFFGTTNKEDFLRDPSGNRRFMPVRLNDVFTSKDVFSDLTLEEVNQIWAEAFELYKKGEPLYLSTEAELLARESQKEHSEEDERKGIIEAYLETPVPSNWSSMDLFARRLYLQDGKYEGSVRNYVCIAEVWSECLGKEKENMDRYKTREINDILRGLDNWEQPMSTRSFNGYGKQRFYKRIGK